MSIIHLFKKLNAMNKQINFEVLESQFRKTIFNENDERIFYEVINSPQYINLLLNEHMLKRKQLDLLLDYYSIVFIALLADYVPGSFPDNLKNEVKRVLNNSSVKEYISSSYNLFLPQVLLTYIRQNKYKLKSTPNYEDNEKAIFFERFLVLKEMNDHDVEIEVYKTVLNNESLEGVNIEQINRLLSEPTYKRETREEKVITAIKGFLKYVNYLNEFTQLLHETKENNFPYLFTAFYHYNAYWFFKMKNQLQENVKLSMENLKNAVLKLTDFEYSLTMNRNGLIETYDGFEDWKKESLAETQRIINNIDDLNRMQTELSKLETAF
jgi:hypothetical protein